jgi:1A family penicillin-binding protein
LPVASAVLAAALVLLVSKAERKLSRLVLGGLGESFSTRVYAAPFPIDARSSFDPDVLLRRLQRLGYRYDWSPPVLRLRLRGFSEPAPAQEPGLFSLTRGEDGRWTARDESGALVERVQLEPELCAELSGPKKVRREPASWEDLPNALKQAVMAAEDKRFFRHWGLDPRALLRSTWHNVVEPGELRGGSTITQQLAKNLFLTPKRTLSRKLAEAALSFYLELRLGKERILSVYLNHIYMGQEGPVSVAGMRSAARFYFGKDLGDLDLAESALLAGMIRSPLRYNPRRDAGAARGRRDFVLRSMKEEGMITAAQERLASATPVRPIPLKELKERRDNEYFIAEVVREALPRYGEEVLFRQGLRLYTTMDPLLQKAAQDALRNLKHQGALVALDPQSGRVLALAGGKDYAESQFNRATQARRQPGSAFKPFLYGAALEKGLTPASVLKDRPRNFPAAGSKNWRPKNYDGVYHGTTTLRSALTLSLNAASLDLADKVGPAAAIKFARRMGVESPLEASLAVALGASETTLLELTAAYAPFANGGFRAPPRLIASIYDAEGQVLEYARFERDQVLEPALAYLLNSLLESVVREGTARALPLYGWNKTAAGKTGTTNDGRDAWFIGYTPELLAGAWVGEDSNQALNVTGAKDAMPVWAAFMKEAVPGPVPGFSQPQGLASVLIDPLSGFLARSGCPQRQEELFLEGTQPALECPLHPGGIKGWLKRWFGPK